MQRLFWLLLLALAAIVPSVRAEFLYVTDTKGNTVFGYSINTATGALIPTPTSATPTGVGPVAVTADPTGRFLYVANQSDNTISAYTITMGTGALTLIPGSPFAGTTSPHSLAIDPTGNTLYVGELDGKFIDIFPIDPTTGALAAPYHQPLNNGGNLTLIFSIAADPVQPFLYATSDFQTYAFRINPPGNANPTGVLFPVTGSPFFAAKGKGLAVDVGGGFVFGSDEVGVSSATISGADGALTVASGISGGGGAIALDPTGQYLYSAQSANPDRIYAYRINRVSGAFTAISGSPFTAGIGDQNAGVYAKIVAVDQTGNFVYVTNFVDNTVSAFSLNTATGALTPAGTFITGLGPSGITITNGPAGPSDLAINKTHTGNFVQGQMGATYTITVKNVGQTATSSTVTVTDDVPMGLTATALTGTGWSCVQPSGPCTRADALNPGASYPAITLTVNVAPDAPGMVVNIARVKVTGDVNITNDSYVDSTTINASTGMPDLTISKTHTGNFTQGQIGGTYTILVTNSGTGTTSGFVTVTDMVPAGLTATAISGAGWTCAQPSGTCSRADALTPGMRYQPITLTVNVAANASATVTNTATVAGGGEMNTANDVATDPTTIKTVQAIAPTTDSVTPNASSFQTQTFAFNYSSVNGYSYLNAVYAVFNNSLAVPNGCVTLYVQSTNSIYLATDNGSGLTGPLTPGSASTLSNSQCTINGSGSSVSGSGNTLTVFLSISAKPTFKGVKTIYGFASDSAGMGSGWQTLGTWTPNAVTGLPPTADSVTPNNGAGLGQTFVYKFSSPDGYAYINYAYELINGSFSVPNGCLTLYIQGSNSLYLFNDTGTVALGPITPGAPGSISNSQCTISGPGSSVSGSGNTLTLSLATTFPTTFLGSKGIYGLATDNGNLTSNFQYLGSYMVRLFF